MKNKLFLEEGEITRILNMHKRAINEELNINSGEVGNKRSKLNEITEDEKLAADGVGTKINALYKSCNAKLFGYVGVNSDLVACANNMVLELNKLKTKEQFDIAGKKTSYWYVGDWARSLSKFFGLLMSNGAIGILAKYNDKPIGEVAIKFAQLYASAFKVAKGTLTFKKVNDTDGNPMPDPTSFKLSWGTTPVVGGGAAPVVSTNSAACDEEGLKQATNNTWYFVEKEVYDAAPENKRRAWTCSKDQKIILYYTDRVWYDTVHKKTPVKSGGGGGGGGATGTRKTYTFDVAEVNKLIDAKCSKDGKAIVGGGNVDLDGTGTPTPTPIPNMPTDIVNTL